MYYLSLLCSSVGTAAPPLRFRLAQADLLAGWLGAAQPSELPDEIHPQCRTETLLAQRCNRVPRCNVCGCNALFTVCLSQTRSWTIDDGDEFSFKKGRHRNKGPNFLLAGAASHGWSLGPDIEVYDDQFQGVPRGVPTFAGNAGALGGNAPATKAGK